MGPLLPSPQCGGTYEHFCRASGSFIEAKDTESVRIFFLANRMNAWPSPCLNTLVRTFVEHQPLRPASEEREPRSVTETSVTKTGAMKRDVTKTGVSQRVSPNGVIKRASSNERDEDGLDEDGRD